MNYDRWQVWRQLEMKRSGVFIPDVPADQYVTRDKALKEGGMLEWERKWLVAHDLSGAGIQKLLLDRHELKVLAQIAFGSKWNQYRKDVSDLYAKNSWFLRDGRKNPFKMLEFTKARDDIGDTPQPKRGRHPTDFTRGKAVTLEAEAKRQESMQKAREAIARYPKYGK